jgi:hypothetical protein
MKSKRGETRGLVGPTVSVSIVPTSPSGAALDVERATHDVPGALRAPSCYTKTFMLCKHYHVDHMPICDVLGDKG